MPNWEPSRHQEHDKGCGTEKEDSSRILSSQVPEERDSSTRSSTVAVPPLSSSELDGTSKHGLSARHTRSSPANVSASRVASSRVDRLLQLRQLNRHRSLLQHDKPAESMSSEALLHDARNTGSSSRQRLLVVANRLPVSATRNGNKWSLELSAGGLVSALLGVRQFETRWIGWAGVNVSDEAGKTALKEALEEKRCVPVFLDEETVEQYYNGYSNNVLWPLFHYLGLPQEDRLSATRGLEDQFEAYERANSKFAEVVQSIYKDGDVIWCHDYHLMFLPKKLKEGNPKMKVGWFLHTPFPSSEIYRMLPSRSELLRAVLWADLIGFHTYDYARHFVSACTRILGLEGTRSGVEDHALGKVTRVAAVFH